VKNLRYKSPIGHIGSICFISYCLLFFFTSTASCQIKYWVEFKDKEITGGEFKPGNQIFDRIAKDFSPKALKRRAQALGTDQIEKIITIEDAPVNLKYLDSLRSLGIQPITISSWANAASAYMTDAQITILKKQSFVRRVNTLAISKTNTQEIAQTPAIQNPMLPVVNDVPEVLPIPAGYDSVIYHYGADSDLYRVNVPPLHAMGFDGSGVTLGFLDVGFRWRAMRATSMHHVIGEYDFIFHDSITANEPDDDPGQDTHGSGVLSLATGYLPDSLIGPAYNPDLILAKTEDVRSEHPIEEDNYAAAIEWMEKLGVDITSSSLGYFTFDSGYVSHTYADMDGKTTVCAQALERAAHLGVLCCTAMGNGGTTNYPYIITPADADSILSVGALEQFDSIAAFSSRGPTADGRLKPEICALGVSNWHENPNDLLSNFGAGTSFATPLVSSSCALIKQAHPEANAQAIRAAVMRTGIRQPGQHPDTAYGNGRLDAYQAALSLGTIIGTIKTWRVDSIHHIEAGLAANNHIINPKVIFAIGEQGAFNNVLPLSLVTDSLIYTATFPSLNKGTLVRYYIETSDGGDTNTRSPRNAPATVYQFHISDTITKALGVDKTLSDSELSLSPNPAHDLLNIRLQTDELVLFTINDALGRELLRYTANPNLRELQIHINKFPRGTYTLRAESPSGRFRSTRKFIVL
jgi:subtilisin family serine protease